MVTASHCTAESAQGANIQVISHHMCDASCLPAGWRAFRSMCTAGVCQSCPVNYTEACAAAAALLPATRLLVPIALGQAPPLRM